MMQLPASLKERLTAWGKLLRIPNLFSVPGDPLAGFLIAGGLITEQTFALLSVCLSGFFAYLYGLISNDIADLEIDREERPNRPLPSGAVALAPAKTAMVLCAILSLVTAAFSTRTLIVGVLLLVFITLYNFVLKKYKHIGPAAMGACRFFHVLLGTAAVTELVQVKFIYALLFAFGVFLYIYGVTCAAAEETKKLAKRPGGLLFFGGAVLAYIVLFLRMGMEPLTEWWDWLPGIFSALTAAVYIVIAWKGFRTFQRPSLPGIAQGWIGTLIGNLIFLQAAAAAAAAAWYVAIVLVIFWGLARMTAVHFYGS